MSSAAPAAKPRRSASARHWRGTERAGAQRQLDDEYSKMVAVVVDDCPEWVHAGSMIPATLRAFAEFGTLFNGCLL